MAKMTSAQWRQYAEQWERAGPTLEKVHREELAKWKYDSRVVDALLDIGAKSPYKEEEPNGLVEMQKQFMKIARRMGQRPSAVREEQAQYGSEIPAEKRQALRAAMKDNTPAGIYHVGNVRLLESSFTAFLCSVRCPGNLILKAYDMAHRWRAENRPVIGGFHSPVEKEVLKIMLRSTVPVCIVLARGLPKRVPQEFRRALDEGRLLLLSPFDAKTRRATEETAAYRNHVVVALADKAVVAYAAPGSKTETFCREIAGTGNTGKCLTFNDPNTANLNATGFAPLPA